MARTDSTKGDLILEVPADLDIVPEFKKIMSASVGEDSLYITAKDSLEEFMNGTTMTAVEKSNLLADMLGNMSVSITNSSMSAALDIGKNDRTISYELTKSREDTLTVMEQRDKIAADNLKVGAEVDNIDNDREFKVIQGWKTQSDIYREGGVNTFNLSPNTVIIPESTFTDEGLQYNQVLAMQEDVEIKKAQVTNEVVKGWQTQAKTYRETGLKVFDLLPSTIVPGHALYSDYGLNVEQINNFASESAVKDQSIISNVIAGWKTQAELYVDNGYDTASWDTTNSTMQGSYGSFGTKFWGTRAIQGQTYSAFAKSYKESGHVTYAINDSGEMTNATPSGTLGTTARGLTESQTDVAIRQKAGFDDNVLQHVANSSASFMGLLLSGDESAKAVTPIDATDGSPLSLWASAITEMLCIGDNGCAN